MAVVNYSCYFSAQPVCNVWIKRQVILALYLYTDIHRLLRAYGQDKVRQYHCKLLIYKQKSNLQTEEMLIITTT